MRIFSVMGWIRFKQRCSGFLNNPGAFIAGLFAPAVCRVHFGLTRIRMAKCKKKTGGLFYEYLER